MSYLPLVSESQIQVEDAMDSQKGIKLKSKRPTLVVRPSLSDDMKFVPCAACVWMTKGFVPMTGERLT